MITSVVIDYNLGYNSLQFAILCLNYLFTNVNYNLFTFVNKY